MSDSTRSGALTLGLILITFGLIFLIDSFYAPFSAGRLITRYWPVILIIIGLKRLYKYFTWQDVPPLPDQVKPKE